MSDQVMQSFIESIPVMQAMADEHRLEIFFLLLDAERMNVKQISAKMSISRPAISHHLKIMRQAEILEFAKNGTQKYYSINKRPGNPFEKLKTLSTLTEQILKI